MLFAYALLGIAGRFSAPNGTDLGGLAVAGATLLLAAFTLELALSTRAALDQAQADFALEHQTLTEVQAQTTELKRQATATEAALTSSWRPILVDVPRGAHERGDIDASSVSAWTDMAKSERVIELSLMNIGSGPAFIEDATLEVGSARKAHDWASGHAIPSGSVMHLAFRFDLADQVDQTMLLKVRYKDLGGHGWRSQASIVTAEGDNRIKSVELFDEESLTPFARTG